MVLTTFYSVIRTLVDCYRDALHVRSSRSDEISNPTVQIGTNSVTTHHFIQGLEHVETL
jgi:hypothetical protein